MKYPPLLDDYHQFEFNFFYARLEEKNPFANGLMKSSFQPVKDNK